VFEDVPAGEAGNQTDFFSIFIDEAALPGSIVQLQAVVSGEPGLQDSIKIEFPLGEASAADPLGPDAYGYIAIESEDNDSPWGEAPDYRWVNINHWIGGDFRGELLDLPILDEIDSSVVIELPFNFRYYGREFDRITVCNNGWIAMGDQVGLKNQQNWPTPGFGGAYGMIAPFWDRLEMHGGTDGVFSYYDRQNGRFIIQWQTGALDEQDWFPNAFEIILFDPAMRRTPTGDSPFIFQYNTVNDVQSRFEANEYCTVGISSPEGKDGLTHSYWRQLSPGASAIHNGKAILWTTIAWEEAAGVRGTIARWLDSAAVAGARVSTSQGQSTVSDRNGSFLLWNVDPGQIDLFVEANGYVGDSAMALEVRSGEMTHQDFILSHGWAVAETDTIYLFGPLRGRDFSSAQGYFNIGNLGNRTTSVRFTLAVPDSDLWDPTIERLIFEPANIELDSGASGVEVEVTAIGDHSGEFIAEVVLLSDSPSPELHVPLIAFLGEEVSENQNIPANYRLTAIYPNPFNSQTIISYETPRTGYIEISLFDLSGREIRRLVSGEMKAGRREVVLPAEGMSSGIYLVRMEAEGFRATRRLLLLK